MIHYNGGHIKYPPEEAKKKFKPIRAREWVLHVGSKNLSSNTNEVQYIKNVGSKITIFFCLLSTFPAVIRFILGLLAISYPRPQFNHVGGTV